MRGDSVGFYWIRFVNNGRSNFFTHKMRDDSVHVLGLWMNIGIMGIGMYTPSARESSAFIAAQTGIPEEVIREKFGVHSKPVPGPDDTPSYMGLQAAEAAIEEAGINSAEIDLVIWNGAQHKDYPCWLAGLNIAHELGAVNAWGFDMEAMCGSMIAGLEVAKSMLIANAHYKTVLLVSGYRNGDLIDYNVPETSFMFDLGAGGAAMILRKGYEKNILLGCAFKGDGSFSNDCTVKVGGAAAWPVTALDVDKFHFTIDNPDEFKRKLGERTMPNFFGVIRTALQRSGELKDSDIDFLAILHFKRSTHQFVLDELGLQEQQTFYLEDYGHIGQNDQVISLVEGLKQQKIHPGDTVVMVGAGLGFVWASAVIRWG